MIKGDLLKAKFLLEKGGYTCVICREDEIFTSDLRGVAPLLQQVEKGKSFHGFSAADKVVGKATAFLYIVLEIKEVYAGVMSKSALHLFEQYGITAQYGTLTQNIINRKGDGICPFEKAVFNTQNVSEALEIIKNQMKKCTVYKTEKEENYD